MLTKKDLQEIRGVVREEVESEVGNLKQVLGSDLGFARMELAHGVRDVAVRVKNMEISLKREINRVVSKLEEMDNFLDQELVNDRKRITSIEERLKLRRESIRQ